MPYIGEIVVTGMLIIFGGMLITLVIVSVAASFWSIVKSLLSNG